MSKTLEARPVGAVVDPLPPGHAPDRRILFGRWARLEPLSPKAHGDALYASLQGAADDLWSYMPYGPFADRPAFDAYLSEKQAQRDPWFYAFIPRATGRAAGVGAFMRLDAKAGVIELGHIWFSPSMQRTRAATDTIYLMMRHAFDDLAVRRLEWKCDALNAPSRRAAERFGFTFEGVFRQHLIVKGRNRDTAWFSMIDSEWPPARRAFEAWLKDANFDVAGEQKAPLRVR